MLFFHLHLCFYFIYVYFSIRCSFRCSSRSIHSFSLSPACPFMHDLHSCLFHTLFMYFDGKRERKSWHTSRIYYVLLNSRVIAFSVVGSYFWIGPCLTPVFHDFLIIQGFPIGSYFSHPLYSTQPHTTCMGWVLYKGGGLT